MYWLVGLLVFPCQSGYRLIDTPSVVCVHIREYILIYSQAVRPCVVSASKLSSYQDTAYLQTANSALYHDTNCCVAVDGVRQCLLYSTVI